MSASSSTQADVQELDCLLPCIGPASLATTQASLLLNELCLQVIESGPQSASHGDIDLLSIAQKLQESGMSVKQTQRCWELFRKRLRDVQKRESEFITASRKLMTSDFCLN